MIHKLKSKALLLSISLFLLTGCQAQKYVSISESEAIIKLLEKEAATWRSGDVKGHAECWLIRPYTRILVSTGTGELVDVPPTYMINPPEGAMGNGGRAILSNFSISINGHSAWVSHQEESISKDGKSTFSYEIRLLEKSETLWKLVGQSIHVYTPKKP